MRLYRSIRTALALQSWIIAKRFSGSAAGLSCPRRFIVCAKHAAYAFLLPSLCTRGPFIFLKWPVHILTAININHLRLYWEQKRCSHTQNGLPVLDSSVGGLLVFFLSIPFRRARALRNPNLSNGMSYGPISGVLFALCDAQSTSRICRRSWYFIATTSRSIGTTQRQELAPYYVRAQCPTRNTNKYPTASFHCYSLPFTA